MNDLGQYPKQSTYACIKYMNNSYLHAWHRKTYSILDKALVKNKTMKEATFCTGSFTNHTQSTGY